MKGHEYPFVLLYYTYNELLNSLGPNDATWRRRSWSKLVQVMACCLTAPSHYLSQCWLIISKGLWHSSEDIMIIRFEVTNQKRKIEYYVFKITLRSPRGQWVKGLNRTGACGWHCIPTVLFRQAARPRCHTERTYNQKLGSANRNNLFVISNWEFEARAITIHVAMLPGNLEVPRSLPGRSHLLVCIHSSCVMDNQLILKRRERGSVVTFGQLICYGGQNRITGALTVITYNDTRICIGRGALCKEISESFDWQLNCSGLSLEWYLKRNSRDSIYGSCNHICNILLYWAAL